MTTSGSPRQSSPEEETELPRSHQCPLCKRAFRRLEHQTRHIRIHTGEKPNLCTLPGCNRRFARADELIRHSRIHKYPAPRRRKNARQIEVASIATLSENVPNQHLSTQERMMSQQSPTNESVPSLLHSTPKICSPDSVSISEGHVPKGFQFLDSRLAGCSTINPMATVTQVEPEEILLERQDITQQRSNLHVSSLPSRPDSHLLLTPCSRDILDHNPEHQVNTSRPSSPVDCARPSPPSPDAESIYPEEAEKPLANDPTRSPHLQTNDSDLQLPRLRNNPIWHVPLLVAMEPLPRGPRRPFEWLHSDRPAISHTISTSESNPRRLPVPEYRKLPSLI